MDVGWTDDYNNIQKTGSVTQPSSALEFKDVNENNVLDYLSSQNDAGSKDYLIKYYLDKLSENSARSYNAHREDSAYQRLMDDLKKAGLSPYALSTSLTPISGANGFNASGTSYTSARNSQAQINASNAQKYSQMFLSLLSAIAVAFIMAA